MAVKGGLDKGGSWWFSTVESSNPVEGMEEMIEEIKRCEVEVEVEGVQGGWKLIERR